MKIDVMEMRERKRKSDDDVNKQHCMAKSENKIKWRIYYFH